MPRLTPPLKTHGGKHYLANRIVELMPPHVHYVEPYAGGLAVLLAKDPEGVSEVVNDLDGELINFWDVLRDSFTFKLFERLVGATPFSRQVWDRSASKVSTDVDRAYNFFVSCRQSLAGRRESFAPLSKTRTRRGRNEQASAWWTAVEGLCEVHERLKFTVIECAPALEIIVREDGPSTLFYLDPPYMPSTRSTVGEYGKFEMTVEDHRQLLDVVKSCKGAVMLSGYRSVLYDSQLHGWNRHQFDMPNNAASGETKERRLENLWCNF